MKTTIQIIIAGLVLYGLYAFFGTSSTPLGDGVNITNNFTIPSNASTTVGLSSTLIVATSTSRNYINISNDSANVVYLGIGKTAVLGKGIRLAGGEKFEMKTTSYLFTSAIYGITTATSNVAYIESVNQ